MDPCGAGAALHRPTPPGHFSSDDGPRVKMNVVAHQKEKNKRTGERENTVGRFQTDCVLPFCVRSGGSTAKKWFV